MRAPFQILAIPFRFAAGEWQVCVLKRSDDGAYQFIASGEDAETPMEAAKREISEEVGIETEEILPLDGLSYIRASCIAERHRALWGDSVTELPEYPFAFAAKTAIRLSAEHTAYLWVSFEEALPLLRWESNKAALRELRGQWQNGGKKCL